MMVKAEVCIEVCEKQVYIVLNAAAYIFHIGVSTVAFKEEDVY